MGGTFDRLHEGHEFLIKTALRLSENIVIGLTSQELTKHKKHAEKIQDYTNRKTNLIEFIKSFADITRVKIVKLEDPYGPPIHDPEYEGLIASEETYEGALKINKIREEKNFPPLIIIIIPILKDENNQKISSSALRSRL